MVKPLQAHLYYLDRCQACWCWYHINYFHGIVSRIEKPLVKCNMILISNIQVLDQGDDRNTVKKRYQTNSTKNLCCWLPIDYDDELMNCFCVMVDRRKAFSLISSRDHCQRSSLPRISDTPRAGFEPAQNLSSGLVEWSCAVVITTTPRRKVLRNWNIISKTSIELEIQLYAEKYKI